MEKYSQNDEQFYIDYYFENYIGTFLEIGAWNPKVFSNTRILVEKNWKGIYVEPSPICAEKFRIEYFENKKIEILEVAICDYDGYTKFYDSKGDAISTTYKPHKKKWEINNKVEFDEIQVECMSFNTLLNKIEDKIDFLNLDVEGTNLEIFLSIPDYFWTNLKLLCIEHDEEYDTIELKLKKFGFKKLLLNGENLILGK